MSFDPALFANPPAEFRPVPFWSWNDHLDVERLIAQQRSLRRAGMGGFFMHSRPGIMTPFLSEEWFAAVKACIEEARASGMQAWLYDEWSFPSGFAGGAVTETRPELARKWLLCRPYQPGASGGASGQRAGSRTQQKVEAKTELKPPSKTGTESKTESNAETQTAVEARTEAGPKAVTKDKPEAERTATSNPETPHAYLFAVTQDGYERIDPADEARLDSLLSDRNVTVFEVTLQADPGSDWLGGFPYPDLLNRESTEYFIQLAYEPYRKRFSQHFGKTVPGIFTDEPHVRPAPRPQQGAAVPWTPALFKRYHERHGERLEDRVIELFIDVGRYHSARHRYWRLVTELFIESFMKPLYEWCDRHGLKLTGHLWEHEFNPAHTGSIMAPLEYMHYPGLDLLGRDHPTFRQPLHREVPHQLGDVAMVKAVTSVGHQLGRERILSETYGAGGYEMSLETQKAYGEWEFALGVTLLNQHLSHYSLRGYRKTDFPISFLDVQPWWPEYRALTDRFARLSYALSQGTFQAELLVLHPMASLWTEWTPPTQNPALRSRAGGEKRANELAVAYDHLLKALSADSWGYDLGDDIIIERYGAIEAGAGPRPLCRVGRMQYQAIVIPPATNLSSPTLRWMEEFASKGGTVIAVAPLPTRVDGEKADLADFFSRCIIVRSVEELVVALRQLEEDGVLSRTVRTSTSTVENPIYTHVKRAGDELIVFLTNVGAAPHLGERVYLRGSGVVESLCLSTGKSTVLTLEPWDDGVVVKLDFERGESHLLRLRPKAAETRRSGGGEHGEVKSAEVGGEAGAVAGAEAGAGAGVGAEAGAGVGIEAGGRAAAIAGAESEGEPPAGAAESGAGAEFGTAAECQTGAAARPGVRVGVGVGVGFGIEVGARAVAEPASSAASLAARTIRTLKLGPSWRFKRLDPNVLVLDRLHYRIGDGPWLGPAFTAEAARRIREHYGVKPYQYWDLQPWRKFGTQEPKVYDDVITFRYTVQSEIEPEGDLELVVEDAHAYEIKVNGHTIHARSDWRSNRPASDKPGSGEDGDATGRQARPGRPWFDDAFRRLPIKHAWKRGENVIELAFRFSEDLAVEQAYLLGDFALANKDGREFVLTREPETLRSGPWISQGYPFFVGRAVYSQTFTLADEEAAGLVYLELSDLSSVARVFCNGRDMGLIAWRPYRLELTPALRAGENTLEIQVASTVYNILGALHKPTVPVLTTPADYVYSPDWVEDYMLVPEGLAHRVQLRIVMSEE